MHTNAINTHRANSVKIHGIRYGEKAIIRVKQEGDSETECPFVYCEIEHIYLIDDHKVFSVKQLEIVDNIGHLRCSCVQYTGNIILVTYNEFYIHGVLHLKARRGQLYVIEKDTCVSYYL